MSTSQSSQWSRLAANAGDMGSIPGSGRSPEEEDGNPLQYPCLENPTDREAWWTIVQGVAKRVRYDLVTKQQCIMIMSIPSDP